MANDEQQSMSIWKPLVVGVAGVIEISTGVYVVANSAGILTVVGQSLIREGIGDIVFAVRRALNGTFSWNEYLTQKLINIPFTVLSVGGERWIVGGAVNALGGRFVQRKVGEAVIRGFTLHFTDKALKIALEKTGEIFNERITEITDSIFVNEFDDIQALIRDLFRLDPANAENLIWGAFDGVVTHVNEDESICDRIRNAAVEFVPTAVELGIQLLSRNTAREFSDRTVNCVKFITAEATSVNQSRLFARNFMRSLQKAVATCRRNQPSQHTSQQTDPEIVEEFLAKFKRRIKALMARKVGEQFRRGLLLASAQSFVPGLIADAAEKAGF